MSRDHFGEEAKTEELPYRDLNYSISRQLATTSLNKSSSEGVFMSASFDIDKLRDVSSVEAVLLGGLGNQMFQYACARSLSLQLGLASVTLNVSLLRPSFQRVAGVTTRSLELTELLRSPALYEVSDGVSARFSGLSLVALKRFTPQVGNLNPVHKGDLSQVRHSKGVVRLLGSFQRLEYFQPIAGVIHDDLNLFPKNSPAAADRAEEIASTNSLAVHIRRGDYIGSGRHTLLGLGYYRSSIDRALREREVDRIFFFSDDPEWLRAQPLSRRGSVISSERWSATEEFQMMSRAKHFVIANSTYSWWAAWLGKRRGKAVYFPTRWKHSLPAEPEGLIPREWIPVIANEY